jgi:hypothetical protein
MTDTSYETLVAQGRVTPADPDVDLLEHEPPALEPGERSGSEILAELRAHER